MENMDLGIDEIKERISERKGKRKPTGKLEQALNVKNRALNVTKSSEQIRQEISERRAEGKPTKQLEDELNSRS